MDAAQLRRWAQAAERLHRKRQGHTKVERMLFLLLLMSVAKGNCKEMGEGGIKKSSLLSGAILQAVEPSALSKFFLCCGCHVRPIPCLCSRGILRAARKRKLPRCCCICRWEGCRSAWSLFLVLLLVFWEGN